MAELDGRVAIVTGSSSGIGEATARRLADLGANVVVNSASSVDAGEAVADALPTDVALRAGRHQRPGAGPGADRRARSSASAASTSSSTTPAGRRSSPHGDLDALTDDILRTTFDVNVFGTWWLTKAAMPHLRQSPDGNVVMVTSIAGLRPVGSSIAYAMTKAALNHLTRLLAKSCGPVRVNAVAPGLVATPWTADWDAQHAAVSAVAPLHRSATPDDCAEAVARPRPQPLRRPAHILVVDGGTSLVI